MNARGLVPLAFFVNPPAPECLVMMFPIYCSLALPMLLGALQDDLPANWMAYKSKDGKFSIHMPGEPKEKKQTVGQLTIMVLRAEGRHDSDFVISYCDIPAAELKKGDPDKRLDQACKGAVEKSGGELRGEEKKIILDGKHPGREIVIEKKGEIIARMRIYLVENRLYQVMVLGNAPIFAPKEKDVGVFLDSFRLNK
jgi:hypothetical protein